MKEKVIQYYENTRQFYGIYHNHKEISAWAALALYVLFGTLIILVEAPENYKIFATSVLTLLVLSVLGLVYRYISAQLKLKDMASSYVAAAFVFLSGLISEEKNEEELKRYLEIKESSDTSAQSSHVLPFIFLEKAKILNKRGRGFQDTTRAMIYGILILITVVVIAEKWGPAVGGL